MIDRDQVAHVAGLAKLQFSDSELTAFTKQMEDIMAMADQLDAVDVGETTPLYQVTDLKNVFREDKPERWQTREQLLKNVPEKEAGLIKVPSILDNGEGEA
ncbi:Asp-tRNA(Asn)/Glu-tRNA(Gln) amidotransferase subunit GatC [Schleiferilactobacillus shenzhenensis]|uniref:Aspartyl/glutamyl-tRNA(Asn/Gln) amidotransferase subunit C n=1 Tax=Schleiferilactobacillus shenzhenensis LY-73 TaxID=1231336 RepID=U4TJ24_9LACO|nr:Asp-tRNA(Asn)/Glu-tRNA(Gln) amidotransferase subunit GatC [Schleiferilactobacillus shenzhenensis]ERL64209.1 GatC [Schleiferilactobacillus shenzhenensis LY-73]